MRSEPLSIYGTGRDAGRTESAAPLASQDVFRTAGRHTVVPRTLCFLFHRDSVLLLRGGESKWFAGRMNGVGGHVEPGESVLAAARREIAEETGLVAADLALRAVLQSEAGDSSVMIFVFAGHVEPDDLRQSAEGMLEWAPLAGLREYPLVDDIVPLLDKITTANALVFGTLKYGQHGRLLAYQFEEQCVNVPI
jgi:8-oxo-dGTP diphosphatase